MLKRTFAWITLVVWIFSSFCITGVAQENYVYLRVEGHTVSNDKSVLVRDGGYFVPLRQIAEKKNAKISWFNEIHTAEIVYNGERYLIVAGEKNIYTDNGSFESKFIPEILNGKLYVCDDVIENLFGLDVYFDSKLSILDFIGNEKKEESVTTDWYDKNIVRLTAYEDAYVQNEAYADTNFGSNENVNFKYVENEGNTYRRGYLKFDLSNIKKEGIFNVTFEGFLTVAESSTVTIEGHLHEVTPDSWNENTITWNTRPLTGDEVGTFKGLKGNATGVDLTDYIKEKLSIGENIISFVIEGSTTSPQNAAIASRENTNESYRPVLSFDYNDPATYEIFDDYPTPEYGKGVHPLDNAKAMLSTSTATYKYGNENLLSYKATETVQVTDNDNTCYAGNTLMSVRYKNEPNTNMYSYIKFDLSELDAQQVGGAYVQLYCTNTDVKNGKRRITLREVPYNSWKEENISWMNMPAGSDVIAVGDLVSAKSWLKIDITDFINKKLAEKTKQISFIIDAYDDYNTTFATRYNNGFEPKLVILGAGEEAGSQKLDVKDYSSQYDNVVEAKTNTQTSFSAKKTRLISSLMDYNPVEEKPQTNKYGSDIRKRYDEGTGFFRVEKIDGRWRFIDPEGYYFYSAGKVTIRPDDTQEYYNQMYEKYGTITDWKGRWADEKRAYYADYGFNTAGGWSWLFRPLNPDGTFADELNMEQIEGKTAMPMGSIVVYGVAIRYAKSMGGVRYTHGVQEDFASGMPPVFNPDFEEKCNEIIKEYVTPWKDNPYIMGWWSDNEISESVRLLDTALSLDPYDEQCAYTHAAAWEWFRERTGKRNAKLLDITDTLREEFREYVYDRYYQVMSRAFKEHVPNHLYFGNRHFQFAETSPAIFKAAERYCDVISVNLYRHWTPDIVDAWAEYADIPVLITEWYANPDKAVGGFITNNSTADCGKFYQNFALRLLESKNVVGFHYFADIYDNVQAEYMKELNNNIYNLVDYFDK